MTTPATLTTDRLVLRPFAPGDAPTRLPHPPNPARTPITHRAPHKSNEDTLVFVRDYAESRYMEGTPEPYAITLKDDPANRPVGAVGCFWTSRPNAGMELGYWLAEPYWGRGLTAEACREVVSLAFASCFPQRVQARVIAGNAASCRVLDKLGFRYEGTQRSVLFRRGKYEDVLFYSVLRSEWPM